MAIGQIRLEQAMVEFKHLSQFVASSKTHLSLSLMSRLFVRFGLFEFVSENVWSTTAEAEKRKTFEVIVVAVSLEVISQKPKSQNLKLNNGVHGHKFTFAGWFICTLQSRKKFYIQQGFIQLLFFDAKYKTLSFCSHLMLMYTIESDKNEPCLRVTDIFFFAFFFLSVDRG